MSPERPRDVQAPLVCAREETAPGFRELLRTEVLVTAPFPRRLPRRVQLRERERRLTGHSTLQEVHIDVELAWH